MTTTETFTFFAGTLAAETVDIDAASAPVRYAWTLDGSRCRAVVGRCAADRAARVDDYRQRRFVPSAPRFVLGQPR